MNIHHKEILDLIKAQSGTATQHTFSDSYLGNSHPRYPINNPTMRTIARTWMKAHAGMPADQFEKVLTSLIAGKSSTEKCMAGFLLDYARFPQRKFPPRIFDKWLDHLIGWVEVDTLCTGKYSATEIPGQWKVWRPLLIAFSKSKNIQKRRASIVLLCSPLRKSEDPALTELALENCNRLKGEKEVLITKAISWVLRSAADRHPGLIRKYVSSNMESLPKIAIRETLTKLKTGKKTKTQKIKA